MEQYLKERSTLFNAWSQFSCLDSCERYGCKEPNLHISVSLVDLISISWVSGRKASDLFKNDLKIGFDPLYEKEPWIGRISLQLKKPCHFLDAKACSVYPGRPIACALFPEYCFIVENRESLLKKGIFQNFPCIQIPCSIPARRKETLQELFGISVKEVFLSDFYLFGISPFVLDLKSIAGEGLEGINISEEGKARIPHHQIEEFILQRLCDGGYLDDWETKIGRLDRTDSWEGLAEMKNWTDQMAIDMDKSLLRIAYQFDGNRLLPIRLS